MFQVIYGKPPHHHPQILWSPLSLSGVIIFNKLEHLAEVTSVQGVAVPWAALSAVKIR